MAQEKSRPEDGPLFEEVQMKRRVKTGVLVVAMAAGLTGMATAVRADGPFQYHPLSPCRLADTRGGNGGVMASNSDRGFAVQGLCGVPSGARAVSVNVTAVGPNGAGYLTLYPAGITKPNVSTVNFVGGDAAVANGAIVPLGDAATFAGADLRVYALAGAGSVHLVLDVSGYFQ
jgi:hypothetical protein